MKIQHCVLEGCTGHQAGRQLLAELYYEQTGEPLPEIRLGDRGKPYFPHSPWYFSITHTKHHAFCALSDRPIGIDAEELDRKVRPGLAKKILSPGELAQYEQAPDRDRALLTFWVLKEAQAKLTGEGLRGYPNQTDFTLPHPAVREAAGCLLAILQEQGETVHAV